MLKQGLIIGLLIPFAAFGSEALNCKAEFIVSLNHSYKKIERSFVVNKGETKTEVFRILSLADLASSEWILTVKPQHTHLVTTAKKDIRAFESALRKGKLPYFSKPETIPSIRVQVENNGGQGSQALVGFGYGEDLGYNLSQTFVHEKNETAKEHSPVFFIDYANLGSTSVDYYGSVSCAPVAL